MTPRIEGVAERAPDVIAAWRGIEHARRERLLRRLEASRRIVERAARTVHGHEQESCPLDHPLVGRLHCVAAVAGVHDLMHVEQLERL